MIARRNGDRHERGRPRYTDLTVKEPLNGLLTTDGKFYPCTQGTHRILLKKLERRRVTYGVIYISKSYVSMDNRVMFPTKQQMEWFYRNRKFLEETTLTWVIKEVEKMFRN